MNSINETGILSLSSLDNFVYSFVALNISLFPGGPGSLST
jgi:hypothetical protein